MYCSHDSCSSSFTNPDDYARFRPSQESENPVGVGVNIVIDIVFIAICTQAQADIREKYLFLAQRKIILAANG